MPTYDDPRVITYRTDAQDVTGAANEDAVYIGPDGLQGRILGIEHMVTTGVTVAASVIECGTNADPDAYATHIVAIAAADLGGSQLTDNTSDDNLIPADTVFTVGNQGGSTAGVVSSWVTIGWF